MPIHESSQARPDDWFPYNQRGYLYFRAQKYDEARADIEKSISLGPEAESPDMWETLIALRQGRLEDISTYMTGILNNPAKNPVFIQRFNGLYFRRTKRHPAGNFHGSHRTFCVFAV